MSYTQETHSLICAAFDIGADQVEVSQFDDGPLEVRLRGPLGPQARAAIESAIELGIDFAIMPLEAW